MPNRSYNYRKETDGHQLPLSLHGIVILEAKLTAIDSRLNDTTLVEWSATRKVAGIFRMTDKSE